MQLPHYSGAINTVGIKDTLQPNPSIIQALEF